MPASRSYDKPDVSVVIVSYNTESLLTQCLVSLFEQTETLHLEVFVVDNASTDGSCEVIRDQFPEVALICNSTNVGYAKANNQAIACAQGRYVLLLNPDTVVLDNAVERLFAYMETHPKVGMCGPKLVYPDSTDQRSAYPFPSLGGVLAQYTGITHRFPAISRRIAPKWISDDTAEAQSVDWCSGACLMASQRCIDEVGGLDERFFMYYEDVDWCRQAHQHRWQVAYYPGTRVIHYLGGSQEADKGAWQRRLRELKGAMIYLRKWRGSPYAVAYRTLLRICGAYRFFRRLAQHDPRELSFYRALAVGR